ncbi:MAG: AEC family transporter [Clostridia bacterium]|nr:AEC family transporter [Clostridia bacterium]
MEGFQTILNSIVILAITMAVGYFAVKINYISQEVKNAISKIIVRITLPILVITSLTKVELSREKILNSLILIGIAFIAIAVMYLIGTLFSKLFKLPKATAIVHQCMSAFGNVIFLGYPLIQALFGAEGLFYAALYAFANDLFVWTLGIYKLSALKDGAQKSGNLKNLVNPATIAFCISFIMMTFGLKFKGALGDALSGIGGTTTYLSMIFIGGTLASVKLGELYKRISLVVMAIFKMIVVPVIMIFVLKFVPIDYAIKSILILQVAMPSQTLLAVLTTEYGGDILYAAEGIFITTVTSLATLPAIYYLMTVLWQ